MVIDDSRAIRMILRRTLTDLGIEVVEACDGQEALEKVASEGPFDFCLVDWNMPRLSGYDFVRQVRTQREHDVMDLIMVTTETETSQVIKALDAGANEYIMKPFTKEILQDKLSILGIYTS